jgi:hypothetical protein
MRLRQEAHEFEASLGKVNKTLSKNKNTNKRAEGLTQVVEPGLASIKPQVQFPVLPKQLKIRKSRTISTYKTG